MTFQSAAIGVFMSTIPLIPGYAGANPMPSNGPPCAPGRICTVNGSVEAIWESHAWMGEIQMPDGRCVSLSLPADRIAQLRRTGPTEMTVSGRVVGYPTRRSQIAYMRISGREIGIGSCGFAFIFVPNSRARSAHFRVEGRYQYIDGDRLLWPCRPNAPCTETLIRDRRLQAEVERSPDFRATLLVERVPACGARSSEVACVNSLDGTALRIDRWLELHRETPNP